MDSGNEEKYIGKMPKVGSVWAQGVTWGYPFVYKVVKIIDDVRFEIKALQGYNNGDTIYFCTSPYGVSYTKHVIEQEFNDFLNSTEEIES